MSEKVGLVVKKPESKARDFALAKTKPGISPSVEINSPVGQILHLQRTIGNRAVTQLIQPLLLHRQKNNLIQLEEAEALDTTTSSSCTRDILAEGTCEFLATHSSWVCCDPTNGFSRPGKTTSKAEPGKTCKEEKWAPLFTCDNTCEKQLEKGCDDNDNWMAIPKNQFNRGKCGQVYTICANGKQKQGYVRDKSETDVYFEVSPGIQTALGVTVNTKFKGAVYRPGADQKIIDKDPCCKTQAAEKK